ncbi:MAG: DUF2807 domain-containing protein [Winogradskyella sp.]|nr:DUF2807 domain-containing protein [Winogradskyella sp.]NNK40104.1 DUF2807 domain-containing protein [Winogradskyella sp.]NNL83340.1 DUF2807 domain-containing protein [Winogradskyella sp.]
MKKQIVTILFLCLFSCNKEDVFDCIQTAGPIIETELAVSQFSKILVNRDIELILQQGEQQRIVVETGENLINDIDVKVIEGQLILTDNNNCNLLRDYGLTKIIVTTPILTEIIASTQYDISSNGTLTFENLRLISEDYTYPDTYAVGNFIFDVDAQSVSIYSNNISFFYLSGNVNDLFVGFYAGAGRFEGEELVAQNVRVYHRGSNDMVVNPQVALTGDLLGTGDLISVNQPTVVDINQVYTGQLIFR